MSDSLRPHGLQHARPPCPSPTPGAYQNSCPLSWWCHPTISSSVIPFSSHIQSFQASGSFQMRSVYVYTHCCGLNCVPPPHQDILCAQSLSSVWLCDLMDQSPPGSSVPGILQQECWSGLPCPPPGDLHNPGDKARLLHLLTGRWILYHEHHLGSQNLCWGRS